MSTEPERRHVAAAVLVRGATVLVQTRPGPGAFQGYWEFPGGGLESGEDVQACVRRECREELGLDVTVLGTLHVTEWSYPHVRVLVEFLLCRTRGEPEAREGQDLLWADRRQLAKLRFLPANGPVLELLRDELLVKGPAEGRASPSSGSQTGSPRPGDSA